MPAEITYLKRRAHTLRLGLTQRLDEIYVSDFPTSSPKDVIKLIQDILEKVNDQINSASDKDILTAICRLLSNYGSFLEFFDNAHTDQTPRALVQILEELTGKLTPGAKLLAWPQAEYNYSIRDILPYLKRTTENLIPDPEWASLFSQFSGPISLVSFPRIERDDILVHAVFGHELGHPIATRFLDAEAGTPEYAARLSLAISHLETQCSAQISEGGFKAKQSLIATLLEVRFRGLEELISDCVAVLLFGPSALFALRDILAFSNLDSLPSYPQFYPPNRYRIRLAKKILDQENFTDQLLNLKADPVLGRIDTSIATTISEVNAITAVTSDLTALSAKPVISIAYDWISDSLPDALRFAKEQIGGLEYAASLIQKEIPGLIERLSLGLPPNEFGIPPNNIGVNWRSSILAAWIVKIHGYKKGNPPIALESKDIDRLQKVTLRAVEYVLLTQRYSTHMTSQ